MMKLKLPISPFAEKKLELVLSTAPKTWNNTEKVSKTENGSISRGSQSELSMIRDLWGKRFTKKVSFEFRVKEWRGDGRGKWRTEGWIEVSVKRWNWFTKWKWKLIPEMRRGILKRAICDLKGRGGRWTSKCDNIRGTSIIVSLKRDEIM